MQENTQNNEIKNSILDKIKKDEIMESVSKRISQLTKK